MNSSELYEMLHAYADGELAAEDERAIREMLESDPAARAELDEIEATRALAREAFLAPVEQVDFSGYFDGVMARIAAEEATEAVAMAAEVRATNTVEGVAVVREAQPSFLERAGAWLKDLFTFEQPMMSLAAAAGVVLLVGGVMLATGGPGTDSGSEGAVSPKLAGPNEPGPRATPDEAPAPGRRLDLEEEVAGRNAATVLSYEVAEGRVLIEGNESDPEQPVVVWHLSDDEAPPSEDAQ